MVISWWLNVVSGLWSFMVPPRAPAFGWMAISWVIITMDTQQRSKIVLDYVCPMWLVDTETMDHLLFNS